jgi:hypothetical protein
MLREPRAGVALILPPFCMITNECGLEVDCNRVQERAYAKGGEYPLPLYVLCFIFENVHVGANNV